MILSIGARRQVAENDPGHGRADRGRQILRWDGPARRIGPYDPYRPRDCLGLDAAQDAAATVERLRPLRDVTERHVRYPVDAALFLNRSAVAEDTERAAFG